MGLFVISPHLISCRKETPQGLGEITLELSPKGSLCSPRKRVFIRSSLLHSRWDLSGPHSAYPQPLLRETALWTDCAHREENTKGKNGRCSCQQERCSINTTPKPQLSPVPGTIISLSFISLCLLCAINFWRPPFSLCLRREAPSNIKKIYASRFSFIAYTIFCVPIRTPYSSHPDQSVESSCLPWKAQHRQSCKHKPTSSHSLTPRHWRPLILSEELLGSCSHAIVPSALSPSMVTVWAPSSQPKTPPTSSLYPSHQAYWNEL